MAAVRGVQGPLADDAPPAVRRTCPGRHLGSRRRRRSGTRLGRPGLMLSVRRPTAGALGLRYRPEGGMHVR
jgi:hypothetical protein